MTSQSPAHLFRNKLWRLTHLYKIRTKDRRVITFKPNRVQRIRLDQFKEYCDDQWKIVKPMRHFTLKYRQGGVSTMDLLWWLDETLWNKNTVTAVQAHKQESLRYLIEILKLGYEGMHDKIKPAIDKDSTHEMSFPSLGSKIFVSLSVRSTAVHNLHISEWCLTDDDRIHASLGSVGPKGNVTGESTGNGVGNDGYMVFQDAVQGQGAFKALFLPWYLQDEYTMPTPPLRRTEDERRLAQEAKHHHGVEITDGQIAFRRAKRKELRDLMPQEFPENQDEAFITSGNPFFNNRKLMVLLKEAGKESPVDEDDFFKQWHKPQKGHTYVAGADTSEGAGDPSCLKILDVSTRQEVFVFRAHVSPAKFARECADWCSQYNNALLAVEANNHGHAVLLALEKIHRYRNLYYRRKKPRSVRWGSNKTDTNKIGWETNSITRPIMLNALKSALEGDPDDSEDTFEPEIEIFDANLCKEGLTFSDNHGKFEAQSGHHDDDVIASAIAFQMYLTKARTRSAHPGGNPLGFKRETWE